MSFVGIHDVRSLIYQRKLLKNSAKMDMISSKLKHRKSCNHCFIVIWKNLRETVSKRIAIFIHPCHAPLLFHTTTLYTYIYIVSQWLHPSPPRLFSIVHPRTQSHFLSFLPLSLSMRIFCLVFPSFRSHSRYIIPYFHFSLQLHLFSVYFTQNNEHKR